MAASTRSVHLGSVRIVRKLPNANDGEILERQQMVFHDRRPQTVGDANRELISLFDADQLGADLADRLHRLQGGAGELVFLILHRADGLVGLDESLFLLAGQRGGHLSHGAEARRIEDHAIARLDHGAAIDRVVMDDGVFERQALNLQIRVDHDRILFAAVPEILVGRPGTGDPGWLPRRDDSLRERNGHRGNRLDRHCAAGRVDGTIGSPNCRRFVAGELRLGRHPAAGRRRAPAGCAGSSGGRMQSPRASGAPALDMSRATTPSIPRPRRCASRGPSGQSAAPAAGRRDVSSVERIASRGPLAYSGCGCK